MNPVGERRTILPLVLLGALACLLLGPLVVLGPQLGDSLPTNLSWGHWFNAQIDAGELYPRWLNSLNHGAGSPVFYFYAPLPFYFWFLVSRLCAGCEAALQLGAVEVLIVLCSASAFYLFTRNHVSRVAAIAGATFFALAPYHFSVDVLRRQALGEVTAYVFMPLVLYFIDRLGRSPAAIAGLALSYAGLTLSHLPAALLFSLFIVPYWVVMTPKDGAPKRFAQLGAGLALGLGLSAIYLIPALKMLPDISSEALWSEHYQYHRWFVVGGAAPPNPKVFQIIATALGVTTLTGLVAAVLAREQLDDWSSRAWRACLFMLAGSWFLMSVASTFVWQVIPTLQKVQFPWRLGIVVDLACAVLVTLTIARIDWSRGRSRYLAVVLFLVPLVASAGVSAITYIGYRKLGAPGERAELMRSWIKTGEDVEEYVPAGAGVNRDTVAGEAKDRPLVEIDPTAGSVTLERQSPRHFIVQVKATAPAEMRFRQLLFPGWEASIEETSQAIALRRDRVGLIVASVPAGDYRVAFRLERNQWERLGAAVSATTLIVLALFGGLVHLSSLLRRQ